MPPLLKDEGYLDEELEDDGPRSVLFIPAVRSSRYLDEDPRVSLSSNAIFLLFFLPEEDDDDLRRSLASNSGLS